MSSCGTPLAVAGAIAEANKAAKKALDDAIANGGISGGVNPADLAQAVQDALNAALPPALEEALENALPDAVNNRLAPIVPQILSDAVNQAVPLAVAQAVTATNAILTQVNQDLADARTLITLLNQQIALLKRGEIPYTQLRPKNGAYVSVKKIGFAGTVTGFVAQMGVGAGTATCSVPVGGSFQAGDDILIIVSGANNASRNLATNLYFERV